MAIRFDRRTTQEECERIARIFHGLPQNDETFTFKDVEIDAQQASSLISKCDDDALGFYFNALVSFAYGVYSVVEKHYSWASVLLYYSVYYACRAIMGFDKTIIIRNKGLYSLDIAPNSRTKKLTDQNDHKMTLNSYKKKYKDTDYLLSNNIQSVDFYQWMTDLREITNYRQASFREPYFLDAYRLIVEELKNGKSIGILLEHYSTNWNLYCFQEETVVLAGTYRLLCDAHSKYVVQQQKLTVPQYKYIRSLLNKAKCKNIEQNIL